MAERLDAFFDRGAWRLRALTFLRAEAMALALGLPVAAACWIGAMSGRAAAIAGVALFIVAAVVAWFGSPRRREAVATEIERRTASPKNLLITAAELMARDAPLRPDVRDVVLRDAADAAARIDLAAVFPQGRAMAWLALVLILWAIGLGTDGARLRAVRAIAVATGAGAPAVTHVSVSVTPPSYAARHPVTMTDPERIDVLAGSVIRVTVTSNADHVDLTAGDDRRAMAPTNPGEFSADIAPASDGFITVQPFGRPGEPGADAGLKRAIALGVTPDHPPVARITEPGKDLFLPAATNALPVRIDATDDLGLASLRLTYTKVTGGGENFTFTSGDVPVQVARDTPQSWSATATVPLPSLGLQPGDLLVYRAVVGDTRPGAAPIESDAFIVQILAGGEALAEGFAMDDDKDRYAISQQMIIVKTEKLIADKPKLRAEVFNDQAQTLAAEQRHVRAEFVFMMGGEFEDAAAGAGDINEEAEAANESELMSGRMQNNGRRDIIQATRAMSNAAVSLQFADPVKALPEEKAALAALQRAFTKSRYILRVLTPRERVDDTRRLTGKMEGASSWRRPPADAVDDPRTRALLAALESVESLAGRTSFAAEDANRLTTVAEGILRADPTLSGVAQPFVQAAAAVGTGKPTADVMSLLDTGASQLSATIRAALATAPPAADPSSARIRGAMADARRKGGSR